MLDSQSRGRDLDTALDLVEVSGGRFCTSPCIKVSGRRLVYWYPAPNKIKVYWGALQVQLQKSRKVLLYLKIIGLVM